MRSLFFIIVLSFPLSGITQSDAEIHRDSLENALNRLEGLEMEQNRRIDREEKVDLLCLLSREYDGVDSAKTFDYGYKALAISQNIPYKKGTADANFTLGRALMYIDPQEAIEYLKKGGKAAEPLIKKDSSKAILKLWANGTYNLGLTYGYLGNNKKELELTDRVLPVVKKLGDTLFLANIYSNIGVKHINLINFELARRNLVKALEMYQKLENPAQTTFAVIQLAMVYDELDSIALVKKTLDKASVLLEKYPNGFDTFSYGLQKSQYYLRTKNPDKALKELDKILGLVEKDKNSLQYGIVLQRYARAYEGMGNIEKAIELTSGYIDNSKAREDTMGIHQGIYKRSEYYAAQADYENAYSDLQKAFGLFNHLEASKTVAALEELSLKYETAKKEKEILTLKVNNEEKKSQSYFLTGIISLLALVLFVGYYVYDRRLKQSRKKELLRSAEVNQLRHEQEAKVYSAMIEGQERERKRLAVDLHDGLGGRLSGISLNLSKLDKDEPKEYPKQQLQKVMKDLDDSLTELRTIARNMIAGNTGEIRASGGLKRLLQ